MSNRPAPAGATAPGAAVSGAAVPVSRARAVVRGAVTGVSVGVLLLALLAAAVTIVVPRVAGAVPLTVLSGSMEPTLPVGALAVVRPVDTQDVRIGDVITFLPNPDDSTAVTHRVTAIQNHQDGTRTFTTQGDANSAPDAPVADYQVRGRVWYSLPWLGYVSSAMNGEHREQVVYVAAGGFFVWALTLWGRGWAEHRRAAASRPTPASAALDAPA